MSTMYKVYGRLMMIGKRGLLLRPGYLPHGPVTTWWRLNANFAAIAPHMLLTDYNQSRFAHKQVFKGTGQKYRSTVFPVCTTRQLSGVSDYGGYNVLYLTADGEVLCAACATEQATRRDREDWPRIIGTTSHHEGPPVSCGHCGKQIESDYGDPDAETEQD